MDEYDEDVVSDDAIKRLKDAQIWRRWAKERFYAKDDVVWFGHEDEAGIGVLGRSSITRGLANDDAKQLARQLNAVCEPYFSKWASDAEREVIKAARAIADEVKGIVLGEEARFEVVDEAEC